MLNLHFIPVGSFVGSICKQISLTLRCTADAVHLRTTGPTLPGSGCKRRGLADRIRVMQPDNGRLPAAADGCKVALAPESGNAPLRD